jgi:hypothetical protein
MLLRGPLTVLVRQEDAKRWWDEYSRQYDLFISQAVLDEAGHGDPAAAKQRLQLLQGLPLIPITAEVIQVARELIGRSLLPERPLPTHCILPRQRSAT